MVKKQTKRINSKQKTKKNATKTKSLQPSIKPKILEFIAKEMGNLWAEKKLINFLINCGVHKKLIKSYQTKWKTVYNVLQKLNTSDQLNDRKILFKIIEDAVHPLIMHEGDASSAQTLLNRFNEYLYYDRAYIAFNEEENKYMLYFKLTKEERNEVVKKMDENEDKLAKKHQRERVALEQKTRKVDVKQVNIKQAQLNEKTYILEINNGEKIISFKSKKGCEGLEKETKLFKILFHLWEFRYETKKDKIIQYGDWISLDNLAKPIDSTTAAVYQNIKRIRKKIERENLPIYIKSSKTGMYKLILEKN